MFCLFLIFAFSCLRFSSFPLLLDFLKPKSGPSNEVIGYMHIHLKSLGIRKVSIPARMVVNPLLLRKYTDNQFSNFRGAGGQGSEIGGYDPPEPL